MDRLITRLLVTPTRDPVVEEVIQDAIRRLPNVSKSDVDPQDMCGVCLTPYEDIFQEVDEYINAKEGSEEKDEEEIDEGAPGLTKVEFCGHTYCRRDLIGWIRQTPPNNTCPLCRHPFIELPAPDDESSDGGEYVPGADDFDDDVTDGFSDLDPMAPSERDELYQMAADARDARMQVEALRDEFAGELEAEDEARALAEEFGPEIAQREAEEEEERVIRGEIEALNAIEDAAEETRALEEEFAWEISAAEETRALEEEFAGEIADAEEMDGLRAEFASELEGVDSLERIEGRVAVNIAQYILERGESEDRRREERVAAGVGEAQARVSRAREQLAVIADDLSRIENSLETMDGMDLDDEELEDAAKGFNVGSDTLMDVYFSDSSSDLDYDPEDYLMSDSDSSDDGSSECDYSIEELDCCDNEDIIAIHDDSSSDSLLGLSVLEEKALPSSRPGNSSNTRLEDTN